MRNEGGGSFPRENAALLIIGGLITLRVLYYAFNFVQRTVRNEHSRGPELVRGRQLDVRRRLLRQFVVLVDIGRGGIVAVAGYRRHLVLLL